VNDTKIASKAKAQLANFMKVFTHFSKPSRKFVEECIYGIQASDQLVTVPGFFRRSDYRMIIINLFAGGTSVMPQKS